MNNFYDYTLDGLTEELLKHGFKAFNAKQLFDWVYKKRVQDNDKMTNLSKTLRQFLNKHMWFSEVVVNQHQVSHDGTEKFLFELDDGNIIETVLMRHNYGNSVCVTTQLGCNIGCTFCASGLQKKKRDLTAGEIVAQVVKVQDVSQERVSHVVVMGIGEPFDNYENTMAFIDIINSPHGLEIGARHITVSTSGIVPKIRQFSNEPKQVNLAISLHASNDNMRTSIMKINKVYPLVDVIEAAKEYVEKTNRRITFEYILLQGVNDQLWHADELVQLLRGMNCYVNLIRYNPVDEFSYQGTEEAVARAFHKRLMDQGITATLRHEKGGDIDAACGQLRSKKLTRIE
ncbi:23S rRNA (adenine(2503)-C(2))-methyltransferase RlmN [Candidatus Xianfuyuplasma coldseepsis]|uniref:Probable dual-specificity RNA methyltransferase RlmN n=1 Tax=Candidatus Xianfuyuplasma coldseepsis TaxID=2782163 RepID=A0A7L7KS72_9MOLU|nr:23S rRNA (adenine(2503)-C(2))-methyltransferase RlmN [Xianfuyuplasma coldseepsis]QMS85567.1 23S rRNA (adenine(2503)-C(2))-methyltransferase RlmN [Xianfuyuplasma coldseepsis]